MKNIILFSFGGAFLAGGFFVLGPYQNMHFDPFPEKRTFEVTYSAKITDIPSGTESLKVWIPLASTREEQTILDRKIEAPVSAKVTQDKVYGNEMAYFEFSRPVPSSLNFKVYYSAEISKKISKKIPISPDVREDKIETYVKPSRLMIVNDQVIERAMKATRNKKTLVEKARAIYDNVLQKMEYNKVAPGWGQGDTVRACLLGKGNCTDFHSLFISMAHAAEIPARFKIGLTVPEAPEGEIPGYHCWAEFYEEGSGWKPVDASEAWKNPERKEAYFGHFDTNKFLISVGRDIELEPKSQNGPANIFFYPYVEVEGKEWKQVKTEFQFKNKNT